MYKYIYLNYIAALYIYLNSECKAVFFNIPNHAILEEFELLFL